MPKRRWTEFEDARLRLFIDKGKQHKAIARRMGRSPCSIDKRVQAIGAAVAKGEKLVAPFQVRLNAAMTEQLEGDATLLGVSKNFIVRLALARYFERGLE